MRSILNYSDVFKILVEETRNYLVENGLKAMVLGISGGIDSTIVAAICHEVNKLEPNIKFRGISMPIKNKKDEFDSSVIVGNAFCGENFEVFELGDTYRLVSQDFIEAKRAYSIKTEGCVITEIKTPISEGNIQARLRMVYLYDIASLEKGIVFSTDNATEYNLGFWTLHGDVGDFNPLFGLWKSEIFELAKWLMTDYYSSDSDKSSAISVSLKLTPTDGLGISESDLEQIGGKSYEEVDSILQEILAWKYLMNGKEELYGKTPKEQRDMFLDFQQMLDTDINTIIKVADRHFASEFKRKNLPIVIERGEYLPETMYGFIPELVPTGKG